MKLIELKKLKKGTIVGELHWIISWKYMHY